MQRLDENLWLLAYPLKMLGVDLRRNCTVIRLGGTGELVIHSMGPFTSADVAAIRALGRPTWLVEAMMRHDTFSEEGRTAFPEATAFLGVPGFGERVTFPTQPILPTPAAWGRELEALELAGVPSMRETVFFHRPSRTLIVCDLVFNFGKAEPLWTQVVLWTAVGAEHHPGMSRPFKLAVKDRAAFRSSLEQMLAWDFDRVIVGHGEVIETEGKAKVTAMLRAAGYV